MVAPIIAEIVEQYRENAVSLWLTRSNAVERSNLHLSDLVKLDARIEANIDGLRIAEADGWSGALNDLGEGGAGEFFAAGILAIEGADVGRLDQVIALAFSRGAQIAKLPYHPAYDPWSGVVSALAWVDRAHAVPLVARLLDSPHPRTRWLGVAACGARRMVHQPGIDAALADREPLVRARAARTLGELGRTDLKSELNTLLADPDEDCRFWSAWSATLLGMTQGARALAECARSPGARCDRALDVLLRALPTERANAVLRPFARDPRRRRALIRATAVIGDACYLPWLIGQMRDTAVARVAGDAFATIAGITLAEVFCSQPSDSNPYPNDDPDDENVALDDDGGLAWPDPQIVSRWWRENERNFHRGTSYFLGEPKQSAHWIRSLSEAPQRQRWAAALELAVRQPGQAMFEVRANAGLQRRLLRMVCHGVT